MDETLQIEMRLNPVSLTQEQQVASTPLDICCRKPQICLDLRNFLDANITPNDLADHQIGMI